ncbi:MAG: hypothetical protein LBD49_02165 [Oscillospiraceae bacterium]|jgi:hypothetical protein|nr:hypothetical protein [Oscillospiraceae bacterium]
MSTSKLKNIVIAGLVFINVFFLAAISLSSIGESSERRGILSDLRTVFESSGIRLAGELPSSSESLRPLSAERDAFGEAAIARAALGECAPSGDGGARALYTGERGAAEFNARGEFKIEFAEPYSPRGDVSSATKRLLRDMGIDAAAPALSESGGIVTATSVFLYKGAPAFNCAISFEFEDGRLLRVTGRRPSGIKDAPAASLRSLPTALLGFLTFARGGGTDCSEIASVTAGYRFAVSAFGEGALSPGWLLDTDAGGYFIDASTGEVLSSDAPAA